MDIIHLKYTHALLKNRASLVRQLNMVDHEILAQQEKCEHIAVNYGFKQCILCGKGNPNVSIEDTIEGNITSAEEFDNLRKKTIKCFEKNSNITHEELVKELKRK